MLFNTVTVRVKKIERLFVTDPLRVIFTPVKNSLLDAACGWSEALQRFIKSFMWMSEAVFGLVLQQLNSISGITTTVFNILYYQQCISSLIVPPLY